MLAIRSTSRADGPLLQQWILLCITHLSCITCHQAELNTWGFALVVVVRSE